MTDEQAAAYRSIVKRFIGIYKTADDCVDLDGKLRELYEEAKQVVAEESK